MASIARRPDGKWRVRYQEPDGTVRAKHFARRADAERWLADIVSRVNSGAYIDPKAGRVTLQQYAEQWRQVQQHRPGTAALYERLLRLHVYPVLGARPLAAVRHSDARGFVTGLHERLAPNTARQVHAVTRTVFRSAVQDRLIAASPFTAIKLPAVRRERVQPLTIEQVRRVVQASDARLRPLIVLAAATGLRLGELLGLGLDRVDFLRREITVDRQLIYVPGTPPFLGPPKTASSIRTLPVPDFALAVLAEHVRAFPPGSDGMLFRGDRGGPLLRTSVHAKWKRALRSAGLDEGLHFHHLRHHYASVLIDGGESVKVVQERLGHASAEETLGTYAHLMPSSEQRTRSVVTAAWALEQDPTSEGLLRDFPDAHPL